MVLTLLEELKEMKKLDGSCAGCMYEGLDNILSVIDFMSLLSPHAVNALEFRVIKQ